MTLCVLSSLLPRYAHTAQARQGRDKEAKAPKKLSGVHPRVKHGVSFYSHSSFRGGSGCRGAVRVWRRPRTSHHLTCMLHPIPVTPRDEWGNPATGHQVQHPGAVVAAGGLPAHGAAGVCGAHARDDHQAAPLVRGPLWAGALVVPAQLGRAQVRHHPGASLLASAEVAIRPRLPVLPTHGRVHSLYLRVDQGCTRALCSWS